MGNFVSSPTWASTVRSTVPTVSLFVFQHADCLQPVLKWPPPPSSLQLTFEILALQQSSPACHPLDNSLQKFSTLQLCPPRMGSQGLAGGRALQPCAACRMLRRKCESNCLLSPYFPTDDVEKFAGVHRVFGASNVTKMIQMVEETNREDAVKAIVYEARARLRDPVYGSVGAIFHLQKMVQELKAQLDSVRSQVSDAQKQRDQLLDILMNVRQVNLVSPINDPVFDRDTSILDDETMAYDPVKFPVECEWIL